MEKPFKTHSAQTSVTSLSAFSARIKDVWANGGSEHSTGRREERGVAAGTAVCPNNDTSKSDCGLLVEPPCRPPERNTLHSPLIKAYMEENNEPPTPVPSQHFPQKVWHLLNLLLSQGIPGSRVWPDHFESTPLWTRHFTQHNQAPKGRKVELKVLWKLSLNNTQVCSNFAMFSDESIRLEKITNSPKIKDLWDTDLHFVMSERALRTSTKLGHAPTGCSRYSLAWWGRVPIGLVCQKTQRTSRTTSEC